MNKLQILIAVFLIVLIMMFRILPLWGSLLVLTAGVVSLKWLIPYVLHWVFMAPFRMKGKVLSGATITVHEIKATEAPQVSDESEYETETGGNPFNWYLIDVTINSQPVSTGFRHWEPGELRLFRKPATDDTSHANPEFRIASCRVYKYGAFANDDGAKYFGSHRLQVHAGVQPGIRVAQFSCYFVRFGELTLEG